MTLGLSNLVQTIQPSDNTGVLNSFQNNFTCREMSTFAEIVDAADRLSAEEQLTLVEILRHRIAQRNREVLTEEIAEGRAEFERGKAQVASVQQIMGEVNGG